MSRPLGHPDYEELLGAYALDAVDGAEAGAVELHLADCPRCRSEVSRHRETAALLGHVGAPAPEGLWDRIAGELREAPPALTLVRATGAATDRLDGRVDPGAAHPSAVRAGALRAGAPDPVAPRAGAPGAGTQRDALPVAARWRHRVSVRPVAALAAVAALVIGALGFEISNLQGQVAQVRKSVSSGAVQQLADVALGTPGHETVTLRSNANKALATAVMVPSGQGYLIDVKLSHLARDQTYQLWGLTDGTPISLGLLGASPDQASSFHLDFSQVTALMITVEPVGGVQQPNQPAVVTGKPD